MKQLTENDVKVPADVPEDMKAEYVKNFLTVTHNTGHLMLFAGDQKIEHLNDDFFGEVKGEPIAAENNDPEHLFRIAAQAHVGVFATQYGMIASYGRDYKDVPYLVKLNSKSHLVKTDQADPISLQLVDVDDVVQLKKNSGLNICAVGYTVYVGSENEAEMLAEAGRVVAEAHRNGLLCVFWMYPRGKAVADEKDPHIIAGAAGVAACLGCDFAKVNYPKKEGGNVPELFKEATQAAGRTRIITSGGSSMDVEKFLKQLYDQIHVSGANGNATGRNIHQKPLAEAVKMANAVSAVTFGGKDPEFALKVYKGEEEFSL